MRMRVGSGPADGQLVHLGLPVLDEMLHGLYPGENVIWSVEAELEGSLVGALMLAAATVPTYGLRLLLTRRADPELAARAVAAGVTVRAEPAEAVSAIATAAADGAPALVLVDVGSWVAQVPGSDDGLPELATVARAVLQHEAVGSWVIPSQMTADRPVTRITQFAGCVVDVRDGKLRIEKADGRAADVRGAMLTYAIQEDGALEITGTSTASLLGRGLRAVRRQRGWSQADLARLAGVSASAISQAERGQHALSLETVLELAARLGVTVDDLVRGRAADYVVARGQRAASGREDRSRALLDDDTLGIRAVLVRVPPRGSASPGLDGAGPVTLLVGRGLVQVVLADDRPVLRAGDAISVHRGVVSGCRNLGDDEALVFWLAPPPATVA